jgi:hypothetical protein
MTNNYPEFYVSENGYELVDRSANYLIVRNGEMRIHDNRPSHKGNVYRYTNDLIHAGITESNLYELINTEQLELIDNPWFEVWNSESNPTDSFESDPIDELSNAEQLLTKLESELENDPENN